LIHEHEVIEAQKTWGDAIVAIGAAATWNDAHQRATQTVRSLYHLEGGTLLFCPTKAADNQFRATEKDAVSYFVGQDTAHPEDLGFALEPWSSVRFENTGIVSRGEVAIAMGNYHFGKADGTEVKVEFSFVYLRDSGGGLKIQLHHSALPYTRP